MFIKCISQVWRNFFFLIDRFLSDLRANHSMARANLNKSKNLVTNNQKGSESASIEIQTHLYLVKVPLNVNIVRQDLLHSKHSLKNLWSEVWKGGFQLKQILVLLGTYYWCCSIICHEDITFIQIGSGHVYCVIR